jgi:hypothetical protein
MNEQDQGAGAIEIPDGTVLTGHQATDDYVATEFRQGGRLHYLLCLPMHQLPVMLPVPDPSRTLDDNREVKLPRAKAFAEYVRNNESWHAGPLTVRTDSATVKFKAFANQDNLSMRVGLLKVPRINRDGFRIVDGQHRQLGFNILLNEVANDLADVRQKLQGAISRGETRELINNFEQQVKSIQQIQTRLDRESVAIDLLIENDNLVARQLFVDVANNALGVPKAVTARFDLRKVVNRTLGELLSPKDLHPLLVDRVDDQKDVVAGKNPNLIAASKVADLIRIASKGITGRFGKRDEKEAEEGAGLTEKKLQATTTEFLDVLVSSFGDLRAVADRDMDPVELRAKSMLGSITMLRVLAGVFYELKAQGAGDQAIASFFAKLEKHMDTPVTAGTPSGDLWLQIAAEKDGVSHPVFVDGGTAPSARAQDVKVLVATITSWSAKPPAGL